MSDFEAAHKGMVKRLFPKKLNNCFECKTHLTNATRKRMMTVRRLPAHVTVVGYQLCIECAGLLQAEKFHTLPAITRDLAEADFKSGLMGHAGGMQ